MISLISTVTVSTAADPGLAIGLGLGASLFLIVLLVAAELVGTGWIPDETAPMAVLFRSAAQVLNVFIVPQLVIFGLIFLSRALKVLSEINR